MLGDPKNFLGLFYGKSRGITHNNEISHAGGPQKFFGPYFLGNNHFQIVQNTSMQPGTWNKINSFSKHIHAARILEQNQLILKTHPCSQELGTKLTHSQNTSMQIINCNITKQNTLFAFQAHLPWKTCLTDKTNLPINGLSLNRSQFDSCST